VRTAAANAGALKVFVFVLLFFERETDAERSAKHQ
jgi:hypothetical protein